MVNIDLCLNKDVIMSRGNADICVTFLIIKNFSQVSLLRQPHLDFKIALCMDISMD